MRINCSGNTASSVFLIVCACMGASNSNIKSNSSKNMEIQSITIKDDNGNIRCTLDSTSLEFFDSNKNKRLIVALTNRGNPFISLLDKEQRTQVRLSLDDDGKTLMFLDTDGRVSGTFGSIGNSPMGVYLSDRGKVSCALAVTSAGEAAIQLKARDNSHVVVLGAANEGAELRMQHLPDIDKEQRSTRITVDSKGPNIVLSGEADKEIWSAPIGK